MSPRDLTKATITAASQRMLPTYPVFLTLIGINFLYNADRLQGSPGLRYADARVPLELWAVGFLLVALVQVWALLAHRRQAYVQALSVMIVWLVVWTLVMAIAAIDGSASFTAWAWPAFVARAGWASLISIQSGETR